MTKRLLRREHVVAASLVGAVVVVVGYASGFGVRPTIDAGGAARNGGDVPEAVRPQAPVPDPPPTSTVPAQPVANVIPNPVVPRSPAPTTEPAPPAQPQHPHPTVPAPPTTPTTPEQPPPPPECAPGLVPVALDTLLLTLGRATDSLGLPLIGALPPIGVPPLPVDLPLPVANGPLDQLIGTCVPAAAVEPPR